MVFACRGRRSPSPLPWGSPGQLRAAYLGGPEYAEMLFWKQSAGRIASSFAHARPFWFYGPILLVFLAPLLAWRPVWAGLRNFFERTASLSSVPPHLPALL